MSYHVKIIESGISSIELTQQIEDELDKIGLPINRVKVLTYGENNTKGAFLIWQD